MNASHDTPSIPTILHPNAITTVRMIMILIGSFLVLAPPLFFIGFALIAIGLSTDRLDGYVARRYGLTTEFGKVYDQISDKISMLFVFTSMIMLGILPLWLMVAVILRDYLIGLLRDYSMVRWKKVIPANWLGKRKTEVNFVSLVILLILWRFGLVTQTVEWVFIALILLANYLSLFFYLRELLSLRRQFSGEGL